MAALLTPGSAAIFALFGAAALAACGGRALEPYPSDLDSSSTAGQGPGSGGSETGGSVANGGRGGASSGAAGAAANPLLSGCTQYCSALANGACKNDVSSIPNCVAACSEQPESRSSSCVTAQWHVLECLIPQLGRQSSSCSQLQTQAALGCASELSRLKNCAEADPFQPITTDCTGHGGGDPNGCQLSYSCSDGTFFEISCVMAGENQSKCSCHSAPGLTNEFDLPEGIFSACNSAAVSCGAPAIPAP